ncbi:Metalloendopeptidase OMA1, mitochondrial [Nymphon striatum]|nr:Metalloendopeptidase OMA1, mitochondrial [Nymphon striatum]
MYRRFRRWWKALPVNEKSNFTQRIKSHKWKLGGFFTGVSVLCAGYYVTHLEETPFTHRKRFVAFTPSQFEQICEVEYKSILEEHKNNLMPASHPTTKRVLKVANQLLLSNADFPQITDHKWAVSVVNDPTENAFALPSGHIFVFTGMLSLCENNDQLGIVLSHEMSHALLRHGPELVSYGHLFDLAMIVVIGAIWLILPTDVISLLFQYFSDKMIELCMHLPYNRMLENEADEVGLYLAAKACFDVRESSAFWKKMEIRSTMKGEQEVEWLSTHPTHENRSHSLDQLIPKAIEIRSQSKCQRLNNVDPRQEIQLFNKALQQVKNKELLKTLNIKVDSVGSQRN